jgi:excisionase family DNA binding protein
MEKQLLSPNSAAQALDVSRSTIYAMMKAGQIKFVSVGADRRIPAKEIKRIASRGVTKA